MSKGTINSGGTDGFYSVAVQFDAAAIAERKAVLAARLIEVQNALSAAEAELAVRESDYQGFQATLDNIIDGYAANPTPENLKAVNRAAKIVAEYAIRVGSQTQVVNAYKLEEVAINKESARLDESPTSVNADVWCADFSEELTGDVGLIEVPGGEREKHLQIRPGFTDNAVYDAARDGMLRQPYADDSRGTYYNLAMRPAWQKWYPRFRLALIVDIDTAADTCDISIEDAKSADKNIDVNHITQYADVPIEYMDCDAKAFEIGDYVLVEFTGQSITGIEANWDQAKPKVIGFRDNPRNCAKGYECGLIDYDTFPPIVGHVDTTLQALIDASQGDGRPIATQGAGKLDVLGDPINPRSASIIGYWGAAPASSWTDLMRRHVQAVYGSTRTDYSTTTTGADCNIIYPGGYSFSCWWGGTTGLMRVGRYLYIYVICSTSDVKVVGTKFSANATAHRTWLINAIDTGNPTLSAEQIALEESAILSGISPTGPSGTIYTRPGAPDAWEGAPLSYGWQFMDQYPGTPGDYNLGQLEAKVTCVGSGDPGPGIGSYTHTLLIEWNGASWSVTDSTATHATNAVIGTGVSIMRMDVFGDLQRWGEGGTTPDGTSASLMGHYTEGGAWVEEVYTSTASGGTEEERLNNRVPCTGTASGRAGRYNHTYSAESTLSSLGIRTASILTTSVSGESTPYGTASRTGTFDNPQDEIWRGGLPTTDPCGDRPANFQPVPCGGDETPIKQHRWMHTEKEQLTVRGGEYGGTYSGWLTLIPARGQPGVWYVAGGEYRSGLVLKDTPLVRTSANLYEGRSFERSSDPPNYCGGTDWDRKSPSIAWAGDGPPTFHPSLNASKITVIRNAPDGTNQILSDGGVDVAVPSLGGALVPIRPGGNGNYDPSVVYSGTLWDNFANPLFDIVFNPPVSFSSAEGIVCYTEEPGNPPIAPLTWPDPYNGTFEPAGEGWAWVGKA